MAKLDKKTAKKVDEQESSSFDALPAGPYVCKLANVKVSPEPGPSGAHYWTWEFTVAVGDFKNRKLWVNTSLSEKALFKMKEVFDAFGYTTDSDTDEMVGEVVKLIVSQRIQEKGSRKGELTNDVERVLAYDGDELDEDEPQAAGY